MASSSTPVVHASWEVNSDSSKFIRVSIDFPVDPLQCTGDPTLCSQWETVYAAMTTDNYYDQQEFPYLDNTFSIGTAGPYISIRDPDSGIGICSIGMSKALGASTFAGLALIGSLPLAMDQEANDMDVVV